MNLTMKTCLMGGWEEEISAQEQMSVGQELI